MKTANAIVDKSYKFSVRIMKLNKYMLDRNVDRSICSQLLRSGTSIGANVREAQGAGSRPQFIHKMHIAFMEAQETSTWLHLLRDSDTISAQLATSLINDCTEIIKILTSILVKAKSNVA